MKIRMRLDAELKVKNLNFYLAITQPGKINNSVDIPLTRAQAKNIWATNPEFLIDASCNSLPKLLFSKADTREAAKIYKKLSKR